MSTQIPELDPETWAAHALCDQFVTYPDEHWKGRAVAVVPADQEIAVTEAMNFFGSIVDSRETLPDGTVHLTSRGYWAHGF